MSPSISLPILALVVALSAGCGVSAPRLPIGGDAGSTASSAPAATMTLGAQCSAVDHAWCAHEFAACLTTDADGGIVTARDQCAEVASVLCARSVACSTGETLEACTLTTMSSCCDQAGVCDEPVVSTEDDIALCRDALAQEACGAVTGALPVACQGVVREARTEAACVQSSDRACCNSPALCGKQVTAPQGAVDACVRAIAVTRCRMPIPPECTGVASY